MVKNPNFIANFEIAKPLSIRKYQLAIEIFMYIMTQTRLDFALSVSIFSKFSDNPLKKYIIVVK